MIGYRHGLSNIATFSIAFWVFGAATILLGLLLTNSVSILAGALSVIVASVLHFYDGNGNETSFEGRLRSVSRRAVRHLRGG